MQLAMPAPAYYGAMNVSGDLRAWSFTNFTWPDHTMEVSRMVRFAGSEGSEEWNFWVMVPAPITSQTVNMCSRRRIMMAPS